MYRCSKPRNHWANISVNLCNLTARLAQREKIYLTNFIADFSDGHRREFLGQIVIGRIQKSLADSPRKLRTGAVLCAHLVLAVSIAGCELFGDAKVEGVVKKGPALPALDNTTDQEIVNNLVPANNAYANISKTAPIRW